MRLQVLGSGCAKCHELADNVRAAVEELGLDATIEKVTEMRDIVAMGALSTPALAIDGKIRISGKVATKDDVKALLK